MPFKASNIPDLHKLILAGDFDFAVESVSEEVKDLIRKMLVVEPNERMSISNMLSHPWVRESCFSNEDGNGFDIDEDDHDLKVGNTFFRQEVLGGLIPSC